MDCCDDNDCDFRADSNVEEIIIKDLKLYDFKEEIKTRHTRYEQCKDAIDSSEGLDFFTTSYKRFGITILPDGGAMCREWAPNARAVYLRGQFNNWQEWSYERKAYGKWELYIAPHADGSCRIPHLSEVKIVIETDESEKRLERISPWAKYIERDNNGLKWKLWNPSRDQICLPTNQSPLKPARLRIYEAHIGIASNKHHVSTYNHFASRVLPRIQDLGYNCILLMAIAEHANYSSMGKNVSNFFAASSRYGSPEDLRHLINIAHGMGISVLMDVMYHEASVTSKYSLNRFDGSRDYFFRDGFDEENEGAKTSRCFDYSKWEVLRFLTSNLRFFVDEFKFDGFRFNGVSSMIYRDGKNDHLPSDDYHRYFGDHINLDSMVYLKLANHVLHKFYPNILTLAEDTSEMPGMCRPLREGGLGFDYRLGEALPNKWMKLAKETDDDDWNMGFIFHVMTQRRKEEKTIAFCENHQQSQRDGATLISALMRDELRTHMSNEMPLTPTITRGMTLHKMIRLLTHSLAGEGYLNFIGNEFGHPDQLELPDDASNFEFARRRFELCDDETLRFKYLQRFDRALNDVEEKYGWLSGKPGQVIRRHEMDKVFVFERSNLLFLFNFHPLNNYFRYRVGVASPGTYRIILDTDEKYFGGHDRNQSSVIFQTEHVFYDNRSNSMPVNLPSRCALVLTNNVRSVSFQRSDNNIWKKTSTKIEDDKLN